MNSSHRFAAGMSGLLFAALFVSGVARAAYIQTNLVSDVAVVGAQIVDPNLKNPWGVSFTATSPFWVSDQGTNNSTLYRLTNGVVSPVALTVAIPTTATGPQGPTGQVANTAGAGTFLVGAAQASFIFANLNGTISAWNGAAGTVAQVKATTTGAVYTGLALNGTGANARLFAANDAGSGSIDVFDSTFTKIATTGFANPGLVGLVPFNVSVINNQVYVTYAPSGLAAQRAATSGQGAVVIYDLAGNLVKTLISGNGDQLASPWGVALAPGNFGQFSNALLIGNFSFALSEINAFDPSSGAYLGTIAGANGIPLISEAPFSNNIGLWAIAFGNGASAPTNALLFAAGINGEADGLIGMITVPEPEMLALIAIGLFGMTAVARRRRRIRSDRS